MLVLMLGSAAVLGAAVDNVLVVGFAADWRE